MVYQGLLKSENVVVGVGVVVVSLTNQFTLNFFLVVMIGYHEKNSSDPGVVFIFKKLIGSHFDIDASIS